MSETSTRSEGTGPQPPAASTDPTRIGRFPILRRIGAGGMGVVLVGRDETLVRDVALKLVLPGHGGTGAARMLREAQAMARVAHPNVVPIYEVGTHDDGIYIAMELVSGQSLADWLAQPRSVHDVLEKFVQAGRGLAAAHAVGILHRDFKPANVLVGDDGRARVVDFGLARPITAAELDGAQAARTDVVLAGPLVDITREGSIIGTPSFMSPEQLHGAPVEASDQWSFGVSLYRALYGVLPFSGEGLLGVMEAVVLGPLPSPPVLAEIPSTVRDAVLRALRRDPAERWPSIDAMVDALEDELRVDPDKDPLRSRRQRRALAIGVVAFALVVGGTAAVKSDWGRSMPLSLATAISALGTLALLFGVFLLRKSVLHDAHGRRLVLVIFLMLGGTTIHRVMNLLSGRTELLPVLRGDAVLVATLAILGAATLERWLGWIAIVMSVYAVLSFVVPHAAVALFGATIVGCLALAIPFWGEPRGALLGSDTSTGSRRRGSWRRISSTSARPTSATVRSDDSS